MSVSGVVSGRIGVMIRQAIGPRARDVHALYYTSSLSISDAALVQVHDPPGRSGKG
jgi:hypothetical protein